MARHICLLIFKVIVTGVTMATAATGASDTGKQIREYVITFPTYDMPVEDVQYEKLLVVETPSPQNVTVNISYFVYNETGLKTVLFDNSYVINSTTEPAMLSEKSSISLWSDIDLPKTATVMSNEDVNVYVYEFQIHWKSGLDAVLVRPVHMMGDHYIILIQPAFIIKKKQSRFFFLATATHNGSTVSIRFPERLSNATVVTTTDVVESPGGSASTISVILNKHQTVSCHHVEDLTGVVIRSDQPLVVTSGIILGKLKNGWDFFWTQLPSVEEWGIEFVTFPTSGTKNGKDKYYLITSEDNTTIHVNCTTVVRLSTTLSRFNMYLNSRYFHHILSNKPIMVLQTVVDSKLNGACMVTLTDSSHWATILTVSVPDKTYVGGLSYTFTMTIVTEESNKDDITINGQRVNITWNSINVGHGNGPRTLVGGQLSDLQDGLYILSSVTGTSLMTAYMMAGTKMLGMCFTVGGVNDQKNGQDAFDTYYTCQETSEYLNTSTPTAMMTETEHSPTLETSQTTEDDATSSSIAVSVDSTIHTSSNISQFSPIKPAKHIQRCHCVKKSPVAVLLGSAEEEEQKQVMAAIVNDIQANLSVPKKNMSATVRRKTSARDSRTSSTTIGTVAVVFVCLVLMLIVSLDVIRFVLWSRAFFRNLWPVKHADQSADEAGHHDET